MLRRFIVMRDGQLVGYQPQALDGSYFPVLVELDVTEGTAPDPEAIIREAFKVRGWPTYQGKNKSYIVAEIYGDMKKVSFVPKRDFDVVIEIVPPYVRDNIVLTSGY